MAQVINNTLLQLRPKSDVLEIQLLRFLADLNNLAHSYKELFNYSDTYELFDVEFLENTIRMTGFRKFSTIKDDMLQIEIALQKFQGSLTSIIVEASIKRSKVLISDIDLLRSRYPTASTEPIEQPELEITVGTSQFPLGAELGNTESASAIATLSRANEPVKQEKKRDAQSTTPALTETGDVTNDLTPADEVDLEPARDKASESRIANVKPAASSEQGSSLSFTEVTSEDYNATNSTLMPEAIEPVEQVETSKEIVKVDSTESTVAEVSEILRESMEVSELSEISEAQEPPEISEFTEVIDVEIAPADEIEVAREDLGLEENRNEEAQDTASAAAEEVKLESSTNVESDQLDKSSAALTPHNFKNAENSDYEEEGRGLPKRNRTRNKSIQLAQKRSASPLGNLSNKHKRFQSIAVNLLKSIEGHRFSSPFLSPVTAPNYSETVYEAADLKSIMKTVKLKQEPPKYETLKELERDIMLMFANCIMFNKSSTPIVDMSREMKEEVSQTFKMFEEAESNIGR